jgi:hypothetical protein
VHVRARPLTAFALVVLAACATSTPTPPPATSTDPSGSAALSGSPAPSVTPVPTPEPTPRYTNPPDAQLRRVIPDRVAGKPVRKPSVEQFAFTPGDVGEPYGELGLRFVSVQVAFVAEPRLSLFAMRVDGAEPRTEDLRPYLAAAGQYVGIAGLHRKPWHLRRVAGHLVWVRPEDDATLAGTMVYTWAADGYVFLMIGIDDAQNRAMIAALPGERPPAATQRGA